MKDSKNVRFPNAEGDATDYKIHHAMAVTRDELRKELKDELSPIGKELKSLRKPCGGDRQVRGSASYKE